MDEVRFGITASAAGPAGRSDRQLYEDVLADVELAVSLGFSSAWMIEHHFSDYFPTPNPLMFLSNLAARYPQLDLGTCVLVTPWHEPLRLAEEIAMLSNLTDARLLLGVGRGTAKFEYDAFGLSMADSTGRFSESVQVLRESLSAPEFSYVGDHFAYDTPVVLRPRPASERVQLFGALGTPASAHKIGVAGLAPLSRVMGAPEEQRDVVSTWRAAFTEHHPDEPVPGEFPIMINVVVEDSDEAAQEQAATYIPRYMQAQLDHYTPEATDWDQLPDYQAWIPQFNNMQRLTDPANIGDWARGQLVGTPDTVWQMLRGYLEVGFNHFILQTATPGVPRDARIRWWSRFANEVLPRLDTTAATTTR